MNRRTQLHTLLQDHETESLTRQERSELEVQLQHEVGYIFPPGTISFFTGMVCGGAVGAFMASESGANWLAYGLGISAGAILGGVVGKAADVLYNQHCRIKASQYR